MPDNTENPPSDKLDATGTHDEALQAELQSYAAALRSEFQEAQAKETAPDVEKHTRDFFKKNVQDAALQVVWLAHNSDSDSIRLRASQFIIKEAFEEGTREGDPIKQLMNELTKQPTGPTAVVPTVPTPKATPTSKAKIGKNHPLADDYESSNELSSQDKLEKHMERVRNEMRPDKPEETPDVTSTS